MTAELEWVLFCLRCGVRVDREMEGVRVGGVITDMTVHNGIDYPLSTGG